MASLRWLPKTEWPFNVRRTTRKSSNLLLGKSTSNATSQWTVVQRTRKARKGNEKQGASSVKGTVGSHFGVLASSEDRKEIVEDNRQKLSDESFQHQPPKPVLTKNSQGPKGAGSSKVLDKRTIGLGKEHQDKTMENVKSKSSHQPAYPSSSHVARQSRNLVGKVVVQTGSNLDTGIEPDPPFELARENFPPLTNNPTNHSTAAGLRVVMATAHVAIDSGPGISDGVCMEGIVNNSVQDANAGPKEHMDL